jgi:hypothetical protein
LKSACPAETYIVSYGAKIFDGEGNITRVDHISMEDFYANVLRIPTESIFVTVEEREPRHGRRSRRVLIKAFDLAHTGDDFIQKTVQKMHDALDQVTIEHSAQ